MIIAAVGDLHVKGDQKGKWKEYFKEISKKADVLLLCGDLTDTGLIAEAEVLKDELNACPIPVIGVLGNHDFENNHEDEIANILRSDTVHILDGDSIIIQDIGFAGIKGFGGGFDNHMLSMFGEKMIKSFVQETVNEELKLDKALMRLESAHVAKKIVLLHFSPIASTVAGEPEVIWTFLGSSRLAQPLNSWNVTAAFHGHAHRGILKGSTSTGVPVFNVAKDILIKEGYELPFYLFEV